MSTLNFRPIEPFAGISFSEANIPALREVLKIHPLVLIRDANEFRAQALVNLAAELSSHTGGLREKVLHWEFGPLMEMAFDPEAKNYLFSEERVPFHWDGAFHVEPSLLLFSCLESEGPGGETVFTDTSKIWSGLDASTQRSLRDVRLNYQTEKKAHYGGAIDVPLVQTHPRTRKTILRFAEEVETKLNPVSLNVHSESMPPRDVHALLKKRIHEPDVCYTHEWRKGDLVIADNFSLIHGRLALQSNRRRKFHRVQTL